MHATAAERADPEDSHTWTLWSGNDVSLLVE